MAEEQIITEPVIASEANAPGFGEVSAPTMQRPEWVQEKFFKDGVINYKELATSYAELEKKSSAGAQKEIVEGEGSQGDQGAAGAQGVVAEVAPSVPGVTPERTAHFNQEIIKDGKLSDSSYKELADLGYPKTVVDVYLKGVTHDADVQYEVGQARIADTEIASITSGIGGAKVLGEMLTWAKTNLTPADLKVYNDAVGSKDPAKVRMAVNGLHHTFTELHGKDPDYIEVGGNRLPGGERIVPFTSNEQVIAEMGTKKYQTDPAYRDEVARRLRASDLFNDSIARTGQDN